MYNEFGRYELSNTHMLIFWIILILCACALFYLVAKNISINSRKEEIEKEIRKNKTNAI